MYNLSALPFAIEELLCLLIFIQTNWLSYDFIFFSSASLRYGENEKLPEYIKQKLQCLSSILLMFSNPALSGLNRISIFEIILKKNIKTHGNEILPVSLSLTHTCREYTCDSERIHETCIFNCGTILTRASCSPSQLYKGKGQSLYFPAWPAAGNEWFL